MDQQAFAQLLGNYGEFVGAIAVVVTLGYLIVQIKQSTAALKSDARQRVLDRFSDAKSAALSTGGTKLLAALHADFKQLSQQEKVDATLQMMVFSDNLLNALHLREQGTLDAETFMYVSNSFVNAVRTPGGSDWWANSFPFLPKSLVDHVNSEVARRSPEQDEPHQVYRSLWLDAP